MKTKSIKDFLEDGLLAMTTRKGNDPVPDFRELAEPGEGHYQKTYEWVAATNRGYYKGNMLTRRGVFQEILDWANFNNAESVLEIACGNGEGVAKLRAEGFDAFGVDVNRALLTSNAMQVDKVVVAAADARRLPFATDSFDFVVSVDFLEHIKEEDLGLVLGEIRRVSDAAYLIIATTDAINVGPDGKSLHETVKSPAWWLNKLRSNGLHPVLEKMHGSGLAVGVDSVAN